MWLIGVTRRATQNEAFLALVVGQTDKPITLPLAAHARGVISYSQETRYLFNSYTQAGMQDLSEGRKKIRPLASANF